MKGDAREQPRIRLSLSSLRIRLLLLVLLATLPALAVTLYSASEQRRIAATAAQRDALRLARLVSSEKERIISDPAWLSRFAAEARLPEGSTVAVIDRNGTILARHPDPETWVGQNAAEASLAKAMLASSGEGLVEGPGVDGVLRLHAFRPLGRALPGAETYVGIGIPMGAAYADADRMLQRNVTALGLVALLALVAAWVLGDVFFLRQMNSLVRATSRLSAGELGARVEEPYGPGELGHLARAFDDMAAAVQARDEEAKRAERKLARLNRLYAVLSEINEVIVCVRDRDKLLVEACRIAVERNLFRMACVRLVDPETQLIRPVASWGAEEGYIERTHLKLRGDFTSYGPTATAIRSGQHDICDDVEGDEGELPWREEQLKRGNRAAAAFPFHVGGRVAGALTVMAGEPHVFDEEVTAVLDRLAANLSFALETLEHESHLRFQNTLLESQREPFFDGVVNVSNDQKIMSFNRRFVDMWGLPDELARARSRDAVLRMMLEKVADPQSFLAQSVPSYEPQHEAARDEVVLKDGRVFDRYSTPVRGPDGTDYGRAWYWRDVTERKRLEQQSRQAQKMEAMGRLAGGVAHDFNNLLTIINGSSELLLHQLGPTDPRAAFVEEIRKAGESACALTHQLLAFGRRQVVLPEVLDLNAVVSGMEKLLRRVVSEDIRLATVLAPTPMGVRADPGQLEQVILNLVTNARDAMSRGGTITIETTSVDLDGGAVQHRLRAEPGPYALLAVGDTGIGMDIATQAHIFDPFFTTKGPGKGTGLGLATVYGIVKQSGGHIRVESEPGRGTTFKIYLPRVDEVVRQPAADDVPARALHGAETVLVVEDAGNVRVLVRRVLEGLGYTVLEAERGEEGLAICQRHGGPIDLLLSDVVLPGMNGCEMADQLFALRPQMRVLYMSGYSDSTIARHGVVDGGAAAFLRKPFTPEVLARRVRDVLDTPQAAQQS